MRKGVNSLINVFISGGKLNMNLPIVILNILLTIDVSKLQYIHHQDVKSINIIWFTKMIRDYEQKLIT